MIPNELMEMKGLTEEELLEYHHDCEILSNYGSSKKLDLIPGETQEKIKSFYSTLRNYGVYPCHQNDKLEWQEIVTYDEGWKRSIKEHQKEGTEPPNDIPF